MMRSLGLLTAFLLALPATAQLKNYNSDGSVHIVATRVTLSIQGVNTRLRPSLEAFVPLELAGSLLPAAVGLASETIKEGLKRRAESYTGMYSATTSGDGFYLNTDFAQLPALVVERSIKTRDGSWIVAAQFKLVPEISKDKAAFRYQLGDGIVYNYSIARTKGDYDYLNIDMAIDFRSIALKKDEYILNEGSLTRLRLPAIHVGNENVPDDSIYSGWLPMPARLQGTIVGNRVDKVTEEFEKDGHVEKEVTTKTTHNVAQQVTLTDDTGVYEVRVTVTESNPFKVPAAYREQLFREVADPGTDVLNALIDQLTAPN